MWIRTVAGTDATELFELSHVDVDKAWSVLHTLPTSNVTHKSQLVHTAPRDMTTYRKLRGTIAQHLPNYTQRKATFASVSCFSSWTMLVVVCHVLLLCATTPFSLRWVAAALLSAVCNTVVGGFGHNFLHRADPRALALDWNGLSSFEWMLEHVMSHHCYPNTCHDHDAISMQPLVHWNTATWWNVLAAPVFFIGEIAVALQGFLGHRCRFVPCVDSQMPLWLRCAPFLFVFRVVSCLVCHGVTGGLCTLLVTLSVASFYFSFLAHLNHAVVPQFNGDDDFALMQLTNTRDLSNRLTGLFGSLLLGLDRQTMHHLFPSVDHSRLDASLRRKLMGTLHCCEKNTTLLHQFSVKQLTQDLFHRLFHNVKKEI